MAEELARRLGRALDTTLSYDEALHAHVEAEAALKMCYFPCSAPDNVPIS
jgi:hypothetical protein